MCSASTTCGALDIWMSVDLILQLDVDTGRRISSPLNPGHSGR